MSTRSSPRALIVACVALAVVTSVATAGASAVATPGGSVAPGPSAATDVPGAWEATGTAPPRGTVDRGVVTTGGADGAVAVSIDPSRTYLHVSSDNAGGSEPIRLAAHGIEPGDRIRLARTGRFRDGAAGRGMTAVFSRNATLLPGDRRHRVPGAIDAGPDTVTSSTWFGSEPTDIPEDFLVADNDGVQTNVTVTVPPGAEYLFVAGKDNLYEDNADPDGDFGVRLTPLTFRIVTDRVARTRLGEFVSHRIVTGGGEPPVRSYAVANGSLPPGMALHDDGVLNGTPVVAGNFTFTVRATDANGTTANRTFTKQVSATIPPPAIDIEKEGGRAVPGRKQLYVIRVENTGNTIARNLSVDEFLEPWFTFVEASPEPETVDTRVTLEASRWKFDENLTRTTISWQISRLRPGESRLLTYQVRLDRGVPLGATVSGEACADQGPCYERYKECAKQGLEDCDEQVAPIAAISTIGSCTIGVGNPFDCALALTRPGGKSVCESAVKITCNAKYKRCKRTPDPDELVGDQHLTPPCDEDDNVVRGPRDPNEKLVAADRFVQPTQTLSYAVHFENVGDAPARNVTVTDRLPDAVNLSTLRVFTANRTPRSFQSNRTVTLLRRNRTRTRNVTVGNTTVTRNETVVERHTATLSNRTVRWRLANVDLAPNATGVLLLSVTPDRGLANGTRIENDATIRFDDVSSLTTNDTVNVVDDTRPSCRVEPLPASSPRDITLSWTGNDPVGRIEEVTILAATDGETWDVAVSGLENRTTTFVGNLSETYRFMCVAEDTAGNREIQSPRAEASTTVSAIDVAGAVRESDGDPAANDTLTIADAARANVSAAIFDARGRVVCGVPGLDKATTDRDGRFSVATEANVTKDLAYLQAHPSYFVRTDGAPPDAASAFPRDGSPDLFGLARFASSTDRDLGTLTLPTAHVVDVTVVTRDGTPVADAAVGVGHAGSNGSRATVIFPNGTNASGLFVPEGAGEPGLELSGDVTISVRPPADDSRFVDRVYTRTIAVDAPRDVTIRVNRTGVEAPAVDAGPDASLDEGGTLDRTGSITDPDSTTWTGTVSYGDGTDPEPLSIAGSAFDLRHTYVEDGRYALNVTVSDGTATGTDTVDVTVANVAPNVSATGDAVAEGSPATVSATFADPGSRDTHAASIAWGDGATEDVPVDQGTGNGSLSTTHAYADDGDYAATVTVTDDEGDAGADTATVTVANVAPNLSVALDGPVEEGSPVTLSATIEDPGVEDAHDLTIAWGDGNTSTLAVEPSAGTSTPTARHTYADDGSYDVSVVVEDDDGGQDAAATTATVENVPPSVSATGDSIGEGDDATVRASFADPGTNDTHVATVDWGDGTTEAVVVDPDAGSGSLSASHAYGDDGAYEVTVTVTDDDGGTGGATTTVAVENRPPSVDLDDNGTVALAAGPAFLGTVDASQNHTAGAFDPGSDDLTFAWANGTTTTYFNDGSGPDPASSPGGTAPFSATDTGSVTFAAPGVYDLLVTVADDDGASATANATKVVTGDGEDVRGVGFWRQQYGGAGRIHHSDAELTAFLDTTGVGSAVFHEEVAADSGDAAHEVLTAGGPSMREKAEAQALAAWLNFASGRVGWTERVDTGGDGPGDRTFAEVIGEVESILRDDDATAGELERAKDLAEAVNDRADDERDDDGGDEGEDGEEDDGDENGEDGGEGNGAGEGREESGGRGTEDDGNG